MNSGDGIRSTRHFEFLKGRQASVLGGGEGRRRGRGLSEGLGCAVTAPGLGGETAVRQTARQTRGRCPAPSREGRWPRVPTPRGFRALWAPGSPASASSSSPPHRTLAASRQPRAAPATAIPFKRLLSAPPVTTDLPEDDTVAASRPEAVTAAFTSGDRGWGASQGLRRCGQEIADSVCVAIFFFFPVRNM